MQEFSRVSPDVIDVSTSALTAAVSALAEPASPRFVNILAQHIVRLAKAGERDLAALQTNALAELRRATQAGWPAPATN